jgi:hypothetical protein
MAFIYSLTDTWADGATTFTAIKMNVTDSASASGSLLMDLQVGGVSRFRVTKNGQVSADQGANFTAGSQTAIYAYLGNPSDLGIGVSSVSSIGWHAAAPIATSTKDLTLFRDAADTLAQRRGTNAQTLRVYNTFTDASNYERGKVEWASNVLRIGTEKAGTGTARALEFQTDGTTRLSVNTTGGVFVSGDFGAATTLNINAGGARQAFFGNGQFTLRSTSSVISMGSDGNGANSDLDFRRVAAGIARLSQNGTNIGGSLELLEMTAPAAPSANTVRIYAEDDGSGKTRLMARFATGAAVQIAIEP